jgi:vacuolar-type H+-ATPase subunit E/Vma4
MASETLLKEVEEKGKRTLGQLDQEYRTKREEIQKRSDEQRKFVLDSARERATTLAQREKVRLVGAARLQAKKLLFDATEKMLENNVASLRQALADYANSKDYPATLGRMLNQASNRLGEDFVVRCRAADANALKKLGANIASTDLGGIGGFKAESKDGSLELDLTFEELLRSREGDVRAAILSEV